MAVESRFVVIRNGVEAKTFMDKKSADEYDKMLDMADNLSQMLTDSSVELSDNVMEELSIFLAQHREDVLVALLAKKPTKKAAVKPAKKVTTTVAVDHAEQAEANTKPEQEPVTKIKKPRAKVVKASLNEAS